MAVKHKKTLWVIAILLVGLTGAGQDKLYAQSSLHEDPGYVDFSGIENRFDAQAGFQANIEGHMLKLVAEASREDDPEFADLLLRLRAIQIRSFPMRPSQISAMESRSAAIGAELEDRGWDTVVRLRDYGQYVDVYALENTDYILGLMMMVVDAKINETIVINIVGDIVAEELGRIGSKFDIAPLSEVMGNR